MLPCTFESSHATVPEKTLVRWSFHTLHQPSKSMPMGCCRSQILINGGVMICWWSAVFYSPHGSEELRTRNRKTWTRHVNIKLISILCEHRNTGATLIIFMAQRGLQLQFGLLAFQSCDIRLGVIREAGHLQNTNHCSVNQKNIKNIETSGLLQIRRKKTGTVVQHRFLWKWCIPPVMENRENREKDDSPMDLWYSHMFNRPVDINPGPEAKCLLRSTGQSACAMGSPLSHRTWRCKKYRFGQRFFHVWGLMG